MPKATVAQLQCEAAGVNDGAEEAQENYYPTEPWQLAPLLLNVF